MDSSGPSVSSTSEPILDFRPFEAFVAGHLPGAVHVRWPALKSLRTLLPPRHTPLRTYQAPAEACRWLEEIGYPVTPLDAESVALCERGISKRRLWQPSPPLKSLLRDLTPGSALDLGCGSGRDAVFLALRAGR